MVKNAWYGLVLSDSKASKAGCFSFHSCPCLARPGTERQQPEQGTAGEEDWGRELGKEEERLVCWAFSKPLLPAALWWALAACLAICPKRSHILPESSSQRCEIEFPLYGWGKQSLRKVVQFVSKVTELIKWQNKDSDSGSSGSSLPCYWSHLPQFPMYNFPRSLEAHWDYPGWGEVGHAKCLLLHLCLMVRQVQVGCLPCTWGIPWPPWHHYSWPLCLWQEANSHRQSAENLATYSCQFSQESRVNVFTFTMASCTLGNDWIPLLPCLRCWITPHSQ